jgi:hypothetical protein
MEVGEEVTEKAKCNRVATLLVQPQSMETGDRGLVTVDAIVLVVEETNKEHVFV